ncbi:MAG: hypothetical protein AAF414_20155, partial [Pseudomonadota bacterium]
MTLLRLLCIALITLTTMAVQAQTPFVGGGAGDPVVDELPTDLTEGEIDAWLATRSDSEIRALLRQELYEGAEAEAAVAGTSLIVAIDTRLTEMAATIGERVVRWADALANLGDRSERIAARMEMATNGTGGMV